MNILAQSSNNTNQVTMSSPEIVDFINESRKFDENPIQLRHDSFMAKVPKVLGVEVAPKFIGTSFYQGNGADAFTKRNFAFSLKNNR